MRKITPWHKTGRLVQIWFPNWYQFSDLSIFCFLQRREGCWLLPQNQPRQSSLKMDGTGGNLRQSLHVPKWCLVVWGECNDLYFKFLPCCVRGVTDRKWIILHFPLSTARCGRTFLNPFFRISDSKSVGCQLTYFTTPEPKKCLTAFALRRRLSFEDLLPWGHKICIQTILNLCLEEKIHAREQWKGEIIANLFCLPGTLNM